MTADLKKIAKELEEFFEIKAPDAKLVLVESREEWDKIRGYKTPRWQAGLSNGKTGMIYAIHPDKLEDITIHKKESHLPRLKHEFAHLFYYKCTEGCYGPKWLNEGLACYLDGRNFNRNLTTNKILSVFEYFDKGGEDVYGPAWFTVRTLIEKFGKEKLLALIKQLRPWMDRPEFDEIFKNTYGFEFTKSELKKLI